MEAENISKIIWKVCTIQNRGWYLKGVFSSGAKWEFLAVVVSDETLLLMTLNWYRFSNFIEVSKCAEDTKLTNITNNVENSTIAQGDMNRMLSLQINSKLSSIKLYVNYFILKEWLTKVGMRNKEIWEGVTLITKSIMKVGNVISNANQITNVHFWRERIQMLANNAEFIKSLTLR